MIHKLLKKFMQRYVKEIYTDVLESVSDQLELPVDYVEAEFVLDDTLIVPEGVKI